MCDADVKLIGRKEKVSEHDSDHFLAVLIVDLPSTIIYEKT